MKRILATACCDGCLKSASIHVRHDCLIPDKRLYILLHVIRDRWQDAWYLAFSIHLPLLLVKNKRQNIGDLTVKSMNIQHSLFIQSYRHGVYRCAVMQGPHFHVSTFLPIRGCFHILLFLSFLFLSVLISKNEAARRRTWKKQVTIPRVDGRGRASGVILSASWARMRHGKRWPQEDVQRQQQNGQEMETICAHSDGLASNPLQHLPRLLPSLSLRGATGATTPPPKNGKERKGTMVSGRTDGRAEHSKHMFVV